MSQKEYQDASRNGVLGKPSATLMITFWEDDTNPLYLETSFNVWPFLKNTVGFAALAVAGVYVGEHVDVTGYLASFYYATYATIYLVAGTVRFFQTSDDFLGVAMLPSEISPSRYYKYNYALVTSDNGRNGSVRLRLVN